MAALQVIHEKKIEQIFIAYDFYQLESIDTTIPKAFKELEAYAIKHNCIDIVPHAILRVMTYLDNCIQVSSFLECSYKTTKHYTHMNELLLRLIEGVSDKNTLYKAIVEYYLLDDVEISLNFIDKPAIATFLKTNHDYPFLKDILLKVSFAISSSSSASDKHIKIMNFYVHENTNDTDLFKSAIKNTTAKFLFSLLQFKSYEDMFISVVRDDPKCFTSCFYLYYHGSLNEEEKLFFNDIVMQSLIGIPPDELMYLFQKSEKFILLIIDELLASKRLTPSNDVRDYKPKTVSDCKALMRILNITPLHLMNKVPDHINTELLKELL